MACTILKEPGSRAGCWMAGGSSPEWPRGGAERERIKMAAIDASTVADDFERRFGAKPDTIVRAPGRVNLIGEHTDYHEGFVLPMAIDRAITLVGRRRENRSLHVWSQVLGAEVTVDLDTSERHPERWARYLQGVASVLGERYALTHGGEVLIDADLPPGGGLSSSSALVVG